MTKSEFVDQVVKASGRGLTKKDTTTVLDAAFEVMGRAIGKDKRFTYPGFGTFTVKERSARKGRNPRTGEAIKVKASRTVGFKPSPSLKDVL